MERLRPPSDGVGAADDARLLSHCERLAQSALLPDVSAVCDQQNACPVLLNRSATPGSQQHVRGAILRNIIVISQMNGLSRLCILLARGRKSPIGRFRVVSGTEQQHEIGCSPRPRRLPLSLQGVRRCDAHAATAQGRYGSLTYRANSLTEDVIGKLTSRQERRTVTDAARDFCRSARPG